jgi:hypothetical protein
MHVPCAPGSRLVLGWGLLVVGSLLVDGVAQPAGAAPATPAASINKTIVTELHAIRALLHQADADYKGHRVKAMHEITAAIHALVPPHKHATGKKPATGSVARPAPANKEPQAVSDAQLQQAIQQLQAVQSQLASATHGNVAAANAAINRAIAELRTALKIN